MTTYLSLWRFTGSPGAAEAAKIGASDFAADLAGKYGINLLGAYITLGRFDAGVLFESPNNEAAAGFVMGIASRYNVSTETLTVVASSREGGDPGKLIGGLMDQGS